jgi:hypothetical protein
MALVLVETATPLDAAPPLDVATELVALFLADELIEDTLPVGEPVTVPDAELVAEVPLADARVLLK